MKRSFYIITVILLFFAFSTVLYSCGEPEELGCRHELEHHKMKEKTCQRSGNVEYWECVKCDTLFSDANASAEIEDVSIPASHELALVEEVEPTCSASDIASIGNAHPATRCFRIRMVRRKPSRSF